MLLSFHTLICTSPSTHSKAVQSRWHLPSKVKNNPTHYNFLDNGKAVKRQGELSPAGQGVNGQPPIPGSDLLNLFLPASAQNQNSAYAKKGLDPVKVKQDIVKALADPGLSKEIIGLADELLEKKK